MVTRDNILGRAEFAEPVFGMKFFAIFSLIFSTTRKTVEKLKN